MKGQDYCAACLKAEAALASMKMAGGGEELARMKRTLIGCAVVLLVLVVIPMLLLVYPMFKLGDIGRCRDNLKRIYGALTSYAKENDGWFPSDNNDLRPLFEENLLSDFDSFHCPGTKDMSGGIGDVGGPAASGQTFPPGSSYLYQGGLSLPDKGETALPLLWDRSPRNHRGKGVNVLRADGAVRFETKELSRIKLRKIVNDE